MTTLSAETYLTNIPPNTPCTDPIPESDMAITYPFPLDHWQQHAIAAISREQNVLVTAKTGSGKTLVGEYQIAHSLKNGSRVFYTTPVKSLSNQKFHDLKHAFPEARVGIMTGDIKFMPDADIVIMTTEILRNLLYKQGTATASLGLTANLSLDRLDAVVFDECHYINDPERGNVWEETIILLPPHVKVILLSATINRPELFAAWVGEVRARPISLIATTHRVVPLTHFAAKIDETGALQLTEICATGSSGKEIFDPPAYKRWLQGKNLDYKREKESREAAVAQRVANAELKAAAKAAGEAPIHALPAADGKYRQTSYIHQLNTTILALQEKDLLPALFFVFNRKDCERYAAAVESPLIDSSDAANVQHIIEYHLRNHRSTLSAVSQYHTIIDLLKKGIAYHHSGLLPVLKEIVEILFAKGLVKVLFCTETFAVGINMPTRTAVFTELRKHDNGGLRTVRTDEYIQMAGRAGRRGKDKQGTIIYLPAHAPVSVQEMAAIMGGSLPVIESRMQFSYEFILKTIHAANDTWIHVVRQSYWHQQQKSVIEILEKESNAAVKAAHSFAAANQLQDETTVNEMVEHDKLQNTFKAATNAAKKAAQKAFDQWTSKHVGPKWLTVMKAWPEYKQLRIKAAKAYKDYQDALQQLQDPAYLIDKPKKFLEEKGFIGPDGKLTTKGVMATEVNEGHPVLMTELYMSGAFTGKDGPTVLASLAALIAEKSSMDDQLEDVNESCTPIIDTLIAMRASLADGYIDQWRISTQYVDIAYDWLNGRPAAEICEAYGIFEGNLTRLAMKLSNLLEELRSIATINNDVDLLTRLKDINAVHSIAVPDSLYLRI